MAEYASYIESEGINEFQVYEELNAALKHVTDRGLNHAAKWTAEIINSLHPIITSNDYEKEEYIRDPRLLTFESEENSQQDTPSFQLAKSLFNLKEYHRVAHLLQTNNNTPITNESFASVNTSKNDVNNNNISFIISWKESFLRRYSLFLAGEKRKDEEIIEFQNHCPVINSELQNLREELLSFLFPSTTTPPPSPPPSSSHSPSVSQSFSPSFSQSLSSSGQFNRFLNNRSIDQSIGQSGEFEQSIDELSINQISDAIDSFESTVDQSTNQSINQSVDPQFQTPLSSFTPINNKINNKNNNNNSTPINTSDINEENINNTTDDSINNNSSNNESLLNESNNENNNSNNEGINNTNNNTNNNEESNITNQTIDQSETNQYRDPFSLYLYAIVLKELDMITESKEILIESCNLYPWNWAAWSLLISLCIEVEHFKQVNELLLPHYMKDFFVAALFVELQLNEESFQLLSALSDVFPHSNFVLLQKAIAHFNLRNLGESEKLFEIIREKDPYGMEGMDVYSNILYVTGKTAKLSYLAHHAFSVDKYSPETCYIIGNFYSLKGQHSRSALYFQRALKLNSKYLSAWTLLGHEYVELQKSDAAVHAYRKAVDLNGRDYRAWYGLGQIYEMLKMTQYAIYYYSKASSLRPYDARMWCALGACYESLDRDDEAIRYYERAVGYQDREGIAIKKLSQLYLKKKEFGKEAYYNKMYLDHLDSVQGDDKDITDTLLRLGDYCNYTAKKIDEAVGYYERLLNYRGKTKDIAKQRLVEIHNNTQNKKE